MHAIFELNTSIYLPVTRYTPKLENFRRRRVFKPFVCVSLTGRRLVLYIPYDPGNGNFWVSSQASVFAKQPNFLPVVLCSDFGFGYNLEPCQSG